MDARLLFPSLYLKAADLRGREVSLTIAFLKVEGLKTDRGTEKKPVLFFEEQIRKHGEKNSKRLVLNKTNTKAIIKLYCHETNEWRGKRITLRPTTCEAFGETVDCIRISQTAPDSGHEQTDYDPETGEVSPEMEPTDEELGLVG